MYIHKHVECHINIRMLCFEDHCVCTKLCIRSTTISEYEFSPKQNDIAKNSKALIHLWFKMLLI